MTRSQAAILRFVLICAAWAVGQTLTFGLLGVGPFGVIIPAALAIGVLVVTEDLGRARPTANIKYWRGQRVDDDKRRGRWN